MGILAKHLMQEMDAQEIPIHLYPIPLNRIDSI